jgi:exodeoxyribonuclease V beta subunit
MRHLYVALTRAKRRVYIPGGFDQAALGIGKKSPLDLFFSKMSGSDIPDLQSIIPILDEIKSNYSVSYEHLNGLNEEIAYSNSGNKTLLIPPKIPHLPQNTAFIQSFSSLHKEQPKIFEKKETKPEERSIHQMPGGAETGHLLHRILEQVFGSSNDKSHDRVKFLVEKETAHTPLENWSVPITESIQILFGIKLRTAEKEFSLKEVDLKNAMVEMAFLYPTREFSRGSKSKFEAEWGIYPHENGMLQGFIDFVFEFEGKIYFIDWKSNDLGNSPEDYTDLAMEAEMRNRGYYLQASIYAEALQKYVKLFDKEDVESLIGGAFYIFIRGGIAFYLPPLLLFQNRAEYF